MYDFKGSDAENVSVECERVDPTNCLNDHKQVKPAQWNEKTLTNHLGMSEPKLPVRLSVVDEL